MGASGAGRRDAAPLPFVTVEGVDGCGKSTQAALLACALEASGREVLALREPGGSRISEKVRGLLLDPANAEMTDTCELLLYEAARAQLVGEVIEPALDRGAVVLCDRFFDSTTAYQAFASGLDQGAVERANRLAVGGCVPALTIVFDIDPGLAARRRASRGEDRMEAKGSAYQRRVREGFLAVAEAEPERVRVVDASRPVREVFDAAADELARAGLEVGRAARDAALTAFEGRLP